jgi:hypothetical protein
MVVVLLASACAGGDPVRAQNKVACDAWLDPADYLRWERALDAEHDQLARRRRTLDQSATACAATTTCASPPAGAAELADAERYFSLRTTVFDRMAQVYRQCIVGAGGERTPLCRSIAPPEVMATWAQREAVVETTPDAHSGERRWSRTYVETVLTRCGRWAGR